MKSCGACDGVDFYVNGKCKGCARRRALAQYYADPVASKERARTWKEANRARARKSGRKGGRTDWKPGEHERAEQALALAKACEVCSSSDPHHQRGWNADHDHQSGIFRGIVCHPCNIAIAHVEKYGKDRGDQIRLYLARSKE